MAIQPEIKEFIEGVLAKHIKEIEALSMEAEASNCELRKELETFKAQFNEKMEEHDSEIQGLKLCVTQLENCRNNIQIKDIHSHFFFFIEVVDHLTPPLINRPTKKRKVFWENQRTLQTRYVFKITKATYPEESYDVIYSRDTLLDIGGKETIFANFQVIQMGNQIFEIDFNFEVYRNGWNLATAC